MLRAWHVSNISREAKQDAKCFNIWQPAVLVMQCITAISPVVSVYEIASSRYDNWKLFYLFIYLLYLCNTNYYTPQTLTTFERFYTIKYASLALKLYPLLLILNYYNSEILTYHSSACLQCKWSWSMIIAVALLLIVMSSSLLL